MGKYYKNIKREGNNFIFKESPVGLVEREIIFIIYEDSNEQITAKGLVVSIDNLIVKTLPLFKVGYADVPTDNLTIFISDYGKPKVEEEKMYTLEEVKRGY